MLLTGNTKTARHSNTSHSADNAHARRTEMNISVAAQLRRHTLPSNTRVTVDLEITF